MDVEAGGWACTCGNVPEADGFYPAKDGREIEPVAGGEWDGSSYICGACRRVFDSSTGELR